MIKAKVLKENGNYRSFSCKGHAEFDEAGRDVVCAAVSMLVINTANALDSLTDNKLEASDDGYIRWEFTDTPDEKGKLLMDSLVLGLRQVETKYGNDFLRLVIEEV
jgi:uncharacterized protein YsxB (DUF464 family)